MASLVSQLKLVAGAHPRTTTGRKDLLWEGENPLVTETVGKEVGLPVSV
jgi:hypothetical protein